MLLPLLCTSEPVPHPGCERTACALPVVQCMCSKCGIFHVFDMISGNRLSMYKHLCAVHTPVL